MMITLKPGDTVGQTFVARHGGLNGILLWLETDDNAAGQLTLHVRIDPDASRDIDRVSIPIEGKMKTPGFYRFPLLVDYDSHGAYRYIFLEMEGSGTVRIGAASGENYLDGSAYYNHEPKDAQLAFQLSYDMGGVILEVVRSFIRDWVFVLLTSILLYIVPGYAIILVSFRNADFQMVSSSVDKNIKHENIPWPVFIGIAIGISLSLYPLLIFWTSYFNLRLGSLYGWLPVMVGLSIIGWNYRNLRFQSMRDIIFQWIRSDDFWPDLAYAIVVFLICATRLLVVRTLDVPMWGDSYQHTMIAQLIVDNGGLFQSWQPYTELETFTYHFGFHSAVAVFHWISGYELPKATLLVGQLINIFSVLSLYSLVMWSGGNRWAGVVTVMVAGLLLPIPMQYTN